MSHQTQHEDAKTWFSPYPPITRGSLASQKDLADLDNDIGYLESILSDLKEKRTRARGSTNPPPDIAGSENFHSAYLTIIENQRRAESELSRLQEERLKLVLLADLAFDPSRRGDHFPHPSAEEHAKVFIQTQKDRLLAVCTVAFFGSGITFSTIFSGGRGSIGLLSLSWAAFAVSFSVCLYTQWVSPLNPVFTVVAYPRRRFIRFGMIFFAAYASFVGVALMGFAVATLNLGKEGSVSHVNTRINTAWGGWISVCPILFGFLYGTGNILFHSIKVNRIASQRSKHNNP